MWLNYNFSLKAVVDYLIDEREMVLTKVFKDHPNLEVENKDRCCQVRIFEINGRVSGFQVTDLLTDEPISYINVRVSHWGTPSKDLGSDVADLIERHCGETHTHDVIMTKGASKE